MFDDLKKKFTEFTKNIQEQMLELKNKYTSKKANDDEEEEDFDEDDRTLVEDIGPVLGKNFNTDETESVEDEDEDEDEEDEDEDEQAAKKKKISQMIKAFAAVAFVFIALDEFVLNPEGDQVSSGNTITKTKKTKKKRRRRRKPRKKIVQKKKEQEKPKVKEKLIKKIPEVIVKNEMPNKKNDTEKIEEVKENKVTENIVKEIKVGKSINNISLTQKKLHIGEKVPKVDIQKDIKKEKLINIVEKKILERKEYQAMTSYERVGRGLVYNCSGGHWACVNKSSYFECKKNEDWSKYENKKIECKTAEVYATYGDCRTVQFYNINTNKSTKFCKE